jgi:hypothetical protein
MGYADMMLSMGIVTEVLARSFRIVSSSAGSKPSPMKLVGAEMYTSGAVSDDTVYVVEARRLPVRWKRTGPISLVIAGEIRDGYFAQSDVEYVCLEDTRLANVLNAVLRVFREYALLDDAIKKAGSIDTRPDVICEVLSKFIRNPIGIFDHLLRVFYLSPEADGLFEWETDAFSGMRMLPTSIVNEMRLAGKKNAAVREKSDFELLSGDGMQYNMIRATGNSGGYIMLVFEKDNPLTPGVFQLVSQISGYILSAFEASRKNSGRGGLASFLVNVLDGVKFGQDEIDASLGAVGWKADDNCCCIVLDADIYRKDALFNSTFCLRLENQFRSCVAFLYKENVVVVLNLDKSECSLRDIPNRIGALLRDGLFNAGISFKYWDFMTTPIYYMQARGALEIGGIYNPTAWCYCFVDYALRYFMHYGFSRIPARHLCCPGLVQLYRYDRNNNTNLLNTLETYMDCNCNAALSAKKLYIHRNTFYKRMTKIHEMLDMNLDDPDTRLYFQISSYIIVMYSFERENAAVPAKTELRDLECRA